MIDVQIEKIFINRFIKKAFRQRLSYELFGRKRRNGLGRFCHNARDMLIENRIAAIGKNISKNEIHKLQPNSCKNKRCYIMSYNEPTDGIICGFDEALNLVLGNGMGAVIIFDVFAVVETEQCFGSAEKIVLRYQV